MFKLLVFLFVIWIIWRSIRPITKNQINKTYYKDSSKKRRNYTFLDSRFFEVDRGTHYERIHPQIIYSFESNESRFLKDAKKYHDNVGYPISHEHFMQYWPTFQSLNSNQRKWYFYWRTEARKNNYLKTDLSYIFIYVYELLCLIEYSDPRDAAKKIERIWKEYRPTYPNLDHYLPEWCGDLYLTKVGLFEGLSWWQELVKIQNIRIPSSLVNVFLQYAVNENKVKDIPYSIWREINSYNSKNKFCQKYNQNGQIETYYLRALNTIDENLRSQDETRGLLTRYSLNRSAAQKKITFCSAIVPNSYPREFSIGYARNYVESTRLINIVTAITKYTENVIRKQYHYSAHLSGFSLDVSFQEIINKEVIKVNREKQEPVHVVLDKEIIKNLEEDSGKVIELLSPEVNENNSDVLGIESLNLVRDLWKKLDLSEKKLLLAVYEKKIDNIKKLSPQQIGTDLPLFSIVDRINTLSILSLGDKIISIEDSEMFIADDFVDEIKVIDGENTYDAIALQGDENSNNESDKGWEYFIHNLSKDELDLLKQIISEGKIGEEKIETFSRERGVMGSSIIESILEKTIDQFDSPPFYWENGCLFIEESDLDILRKATL